MRRHSLDQPPLTQPIRCFLLVLAAGLGVMLGVARCLEPDPRGFGTHGQLGLGPCSFAVLTGRPCPSCGMTTAVAHATRGRLDRSWNSNPAGALLAVCSVPLIGWLILCSWKRRPIGFRTVEGPLLGLLLSIVVVSAAFWLMRILGGPAYLAPTGATPVFGPVQLAPETRKEGL